MKFDSMALLQSALLEVLMRNFWLIPPTLIILLASGAAQVNKQSAEVTPPSSILELTLKADHAFRMSDRLRIETRLANIGHEAVYIWEWDMCWNPVRGLSMRITDPHGSAVQSPFLLDCIPPPPRPGAYISSLSSNRMHSMVIARNLKCPIW
jgi:hypothetical protein